MSTTNRAFIKAYRQDTAQPKVGGESKIAVENAAALQTRRPAVVGGAVSGDPRTTASHVSASLVSTEPVAGRDANASVGGTRQRTTDRRPLSSYLGKTRQDDSHTETTPVEIFRPGTTVASFQWPAVCRALLQQSGPQLDLIVRIMMLRAKAGNALIGILGLFNRSGATTSSLCLAARAARQGHRVIVVDGNFCRPRLATLLEAVPTAGWEEVLKQSAKLPDAAIHASSDRLDILALGPRPVQEPQPLANGLQAAVTAGVLRHAYDVVLLDLGTFFDPASQPVVLELVRNMGIDAVVAVTGPDAADPRDVATIVEYLDQTGCEMLGVIENRIAKPQAA